MRTQVPGVYCGVVTGTELDEVESLEVAYALPISNAAPMAIATAMGPHFHSGAVWAETTIPEGGGGRSSERSGRVGLGGAAT